MANLSAVKALIVEDDEISVHVLKTLLENLSIQTRVILINGGQASVLQSAEGADLVFLDLEMPSVDGYSALSILRGNPAFANARIVAYTTHISHLNAAMEAGFDGFLGKPLDSRRFRDQLERILAGQPVWEVQ